MLPLALAVRVLLVPAALPQDPTPPRILVDGELWSPYLSSDFVPLSGDPYRPCAGDLVRLGDYWLTLPPGDELRFVGAAGPVGRLFVETEAGRPLVAVDGPTLLELNAEQRRALRGVRLSQWSDDVARSLADLGPDAVVRIGSSCAVGDERRFPPLPSTLHHLVVECDTRKGFGDWSAVARLTDLHVLRLGGNYKGFSTVDLAPFAVATRLRALDIDQTKVAGTEVVAGFRALRVLRWEEPPLEDLEPLRDLTELRVLRLRDGRHRSLAPLAELPHLVALDTSFSPVDDLPPAGFPKLRNLCLHATEVSIGTLRAFRRHRPNCEVLARPDPDQLRATLAAADRLVVREGGTCHMSGAERVLAEVTDAATIRDVAAWLDVNPKTRGFHCMCCGDPTLIFQVGDRAVATVAIHHGRSIRWADGPWTSDALLVDSSTAALAAWLATIGAPGPKSELDLARARRAAAKMRHTLRRALIDSETLEAVEDDATAALRDDALDLVEALRLAGCHEGAWNQLDALDRELHAALRARRSDLDRDAVVAAAAADPRVARGLAAQLFRSTTDDPLPPEWVAPLLRTAATAGLRHPQPFNRARTVQVLRDLDGGAARDQLREALAGRFTPREVPAEALIGPSGRVVVTPSDPVLDRRGASTRTLAGLALIARDDTESFDAVRAWAREADQLERAALRDALGDR